MKEQRDKHIISHWMRFGRLAHSLGTCSISSCYASSYTVEAMDQSWSGINPSSNGRHWHTAEHEHPLYWTGVASPAVIAR